MKIIIFDKEIQISEKNKTTGTIFTIINQELDAMGHLLKYLIIDGTQIHSDFEQIITTNIQTIKEIQVVVTTNAQITMENVMLINQYLKEVVPQIKELVGELYTNITKESWEKFGGLMQGLIFLKQAITETGNSVGQFNDLKIEKNWEAAMKKYEKIDEVMEAIEEAMSKKDFILTADILQYEVLKVVEDTYKVTKKIKGKKVN